MVFGQPAAPSETCMSLPICVVTGPQSQSFEEVRIANYLESYRATGRPPAPCPEYPADPAARAAQRLPPLFVPAPFPPSPAAQGSGIFGGPPSASVSAPSPFGAPIASTSASTAAAITDPARLPLPQSLALPVPAPEGEAFASVAAAPEYAHWSHDELRYYAYLRGARVPPPGTTFYPFLSNPVAASAVAAPGNAPGDGSGDQFVSITCRPEFAGHSVEELRLSFLRTGAELTSAQIFSGATSSSSTPALVTPVNSLTPATPLRPSLAPFQPQPAPQNHFSPPQPVGFSFSGGAPATPVAPVGGGFSFGGTPAPAAPAPSLFGAPAQAQRAPSLFGAPPPNSTLFGGAQPAQAPSLFGAPPAQQHQPAPSIFGGAPATFGAPAQTQPGQQLGAGQQQGGFAFGAAATGGGGAGFSFGGRRGF
ncbi:hypothetical protein C8R44DRAFT_865628 [Mycena epipterygia]|nr:hypothetical protein C8R44DRAFT_865628 [Mycena epipterygia]